MPPLRYQASASVFLRLFISLIVILGAVWLWRAATDATALLQQSRNSPPPPPAAGLPTWASKNSPDVPAVNWPEYQGAKRIGYSTSVINGVEVVSEETLWRTSPAEALIFFKTQMEARGWVDLTTEEFGIQPELLNLGKNSAEAESLGQVFDRLLGSELVLARGPWRIHLSVLPDGSSPATRTRASIFAAKTASLKEFSNTLIETAAKSSSKPGGQIVDSFSGTARESFRTTMRSDARSPMQAFASSINDLREQGWQQVAKIPPAPGNHQHFAWLSRGREYAALAVNRPDGSRETVVTLVTVSPK
jgi:hypothetical protein